MRKFSLVVASAFLMFTGSIMAHGTETKTADPSTLSTQIAKMLSENNFLESNTDLTAQVRFTLNNEGQIVVLSVKSENEVMVGFVKSRLNYQKVEVTKVEEGKIYTVPVRIAV